MGPLSKAIEKELIKWSQKTTLLNRNSSSQYSSLIMQTPIGQAKKITGAWDRVAKKSQNKRGTFRILFEEEENVKEGTDDQIYDDYELYHEVEKSYLSQMEENDQFRVSDTMKYLKQRDETASTRKEVDRKASKNRKIRFNVHPKLLNFMASQGVSEIEARDEIVKNLFNCRANEVVEKQEQEHETYYIDM